jgi:hypothetical protein
MPGDHVDNVSRRMPPERIGGIIAMAMGAIALAESWRLYPLRMGTLVGDHLMPMDSPTLEHGETGRIHVHAAPEQKLLVR